MPKNNDTPDFVPDDEVPEAPTDEYQQVEPGEAESEDFEVSKEEVLEEGIYRCRFEKGMVKGGQNQPNWQFIFKFITLEGESVGKELTAFVTLKKDGVEKNVGWKLDQIMSALNAPFKEVNGKIVWKGSFPMLYGRAVLVDVGRYQGRESVGNISPPDERAEELAKDYV